MKYTLFITDTNGNTTEKQIEALNAKRAHELIPVSDGYTVKAFPTTTDENGNINEYALLRGALQVAKRCAEKALANGGTDTQRRIANELVTVNAKAGANGAEKYGANYLLDLISRTSSDSQNFHSEAYTAILQAHNNGLPINEQYRDAFKAVNRYIMKQRSATKKECSTEYIQEAGGNIVAVNTVIHRLINSDEKYIPTVGGEMDDKTAERLGLVLASAIATLSPRQKQIVELLAKQYSERAIMAKLAIKSEQTYNDHIIIIRDNVLDYIQKNAPEFSTLIDDISTRFDRKRRTEHNNGRKEHNAKDRHKNDEKRRKQNAEKQKAYRERKKRTANASNTATETKKTIIIYDIVSKNNIVVKNFTEEVPVGWTLECIADHIKNYLIPMGDIINVRCNNPEVVALLKN